MTFLNMTLDGCRTFLSIAWIALLSTSAGCRAEEKMVGVLKPEKVAVIPICAVSGDGKQLAQADGNGDILIYSLANQKVEKHLKGRQRAITNMTFSPDRRFLLAVEKNRRDEIHDQIVLWDVVNGEIALVLNGEKLHYASIHDVAFHPSGSHFLMGGWEGSRGPGKGWASLIETTTGKEIKRFGCNLRIALGCAI